MNNSVDIKLVHKYLTRTLSDFDDFMLRNGIEYSIAYGTLLGAVRHQGFIPWDDDIDILITRGNYEKLLLLENKLPSYFYLQRSEVDPAYRLPFPKLRDNRLYVREGNDNDFGNSNGGFIDIFIVDGYDKDLYKRLCGIRKLKKIELYREGFLSSNKLFYYLLSLPKNIGRFLMRKGFEKIVDECFDKVEESTYMACSLYLLDTIWKTEDFFPVERKYIFEGLRLPGPKNYDPILKSFGYGEYMQLPPKDKRHTHLVEFRVLVP